MAVVLISSRAERVLPSRVLLPGPVTVVRPSTVFPVIVTPDVVALTSTVVDTRLFETVTVLVLSRTRLVIRLPSSRAPDAPVTRVAPRRLLRIWIFGAPVELTP